MIERSVDLSGRWLARHDPDDIGVAQRWWNFAPWWKTCDSVEVPGAWQRSLGAGVRGVVWLGKATRIPTEWKQRHEHGGVGDGPSSRRLWIRFDSVATDCTLWINGVEIGRHVGDFVPFEFDITDAACLARTECPFPPFRPEEIQVSLRIDQMHAPRPAPGVLTEHGHITKGFHDVLSLQHAGVWGDASIRRTGPIAIRPNGVAVDADPLTGIVKVRVELHAHRRNGTLIVRIEPPPEDSASDARRSPIETSSAGISPGDAELECEIRVDSPQAWSPEHPSLYRLTCDVIDADDARPGASEMSISDSLSLRFGFRAVTLGGPRNRRVLLNGRPIQFRAMLHWGHEPAHVAPSPTPEQVRAEFVAMRARGFNMICLCMVFMPGWYYDLADEQGMLIWQEHPVWKSPMGESHHDEYKRLFGEFFRLTRNHPSVVLVSGACEHEGFSRELAAWWWGRSARELPRTLRQVQTAFFAWTDPAQTDLYDEHTYDNSGRWGAYLRDVWDAIDRLPDPEKPFILGETIIANSWPDVPAMRAALENGPGRAGGVGDRHERVDARSAADLAAVEVGSAPAAKPWWITRGLDECDAFERDLAARRGDGALHRFRVLAHRHGLNLRQFQCELLRMNPDNAGWVMNHLRDVPACRCGFMDDLDRWRHEPHELRGFLSDRALLLETTGHLRGFLAGETLRATIRLANFGHDRWDGEVSLAMDIHGTSVPLPPVRLHVPVGEVGAASITLGRFRVERPTRITLDASGSGLVPNRWTLWMLPDDSGWEQDTLIHDAAPFGKDELAATFEEKRYSSGWGLACESWAPRAPIPSALAPSAGLWTPGHVIAPQAVVLTHRLDAAIVDHITRGGRALLFASHAAGGLDARTVMLWGGVPHVVEHNPTSADGRIAPPEHSVPVRSGESECIVDLLHHDLFARWQRMVPTQDMGLASIGSQGSSAANVEPIIRFLHTHDSGVPKIFDAAFSLRVGDGMLVVSSLDHHEPAGRFMLSRLVRHASRTPIDAFPPIDRSRIERWIA